MDGNLPLSKLNKGDKGQVVQIGFGALETNYHKELERRLLEMGIVEGTQVQLLHYGPIGRDPIAVLVGDSYFVALRQQEASLVLVKKLN